MIDLLLHGEEALSPLSIRVLGPLFYPSGNTPSPAPPPSPAQAPALPPPLHCGSELDGPRFCQRLRFLLPSPADSCWPGLQEAGLDALLGIQTANEMVPEGTQTETSETGLPLHLIVHFSLGFSGPPADSCC